MYNNRYIVQYSQPRNIRNARSILQKVAYTVELLKIDFGSLRFRGCVVIGRLSSGGGGGAVGSGGGVIGELHGQFEGRGSGFS